MTRPRIRYTLSALLAVLAPISAACQGNALPEGEVVITPIAHSSLQIEYAGTVVHVDPWSDGDYSRASKADLILITDTPGHHLDPAAILAIRKPGAPIVIPAAGREAVPDGIVMANGTSRTIAGVMIEATPAYDLTPGEPYHPKGDANGYLLTIGGKRILIAGVTECVPELRALQNIDVAFMPVFLPQGRMTPQSSAECVRSIRPKVVYPYHYENSNTPVDIEEFRAALRGEPVEVRIGGFYPDEPAQ
jgi:L-ascorbate metabolism protein UlaG (beta-lactamase superfamily)